MLLTRARADQAAWAQLRAIVEERAAEVGAGTSPPRRRRAVDLGESPRLDSRQALDLRTVERRLGIHRRTLAAHLEAGTIRAVVFGDRTRVTMEELERVLREGLPSLRRKAPRSQKPRRVKRAGNEAAAIRALVV